MDKNFYHFSWTGKLLASVPTGGRIFAKPARFREKYIAFGDNDMAVRFYDAELKKTAFAVQHSERIVTAISFNGNSAYFEDFANRVWTLDLNKLTPMG